MWNDMGAHGGGWGMGFGMIGVLLLCVLIIVVLVRWTSGSGPHSRPHSKSALDVLKERYARGEIDKQEFEEKKPHLD
jgi:putative membrane protein